MPQPLPLTQREAAVAEGLRQLELACLPTSLEWHTWWNEWARHVEMKFPWERAIVDAITRLQKNQITLARMIRNEGAAKVMIRYNSEGYVWGEETRMPDEITREALVWYLNSIRPALLKPNDKPQPGVPEWAVILAKGVQGCFLQQARLGIELAAVKRRGYLTLNHSATRPVPSEKEFYDKGMEAFDNFDATGEEQIY